MNEEDLREILKLAEKREAAHYAWLRHILLLGTGSLSVLVSLGAGSHSAGMALFAMRVAWAALGCGILLVATALYGEPATAASLVKLASESYKSAPSGAPPSPVVARTPAICRWCSRWGPASMGLAVVALVIYAELR